MRGELFVSSVSSVLGGSYTYPGGLTSRGSSDGNDGGATIVGSPSLGGSGVYEVMPGYRDQVISPVSQGMEEGEDMFEMPTGSRQGGMPTGLESDPLRLSLRALTMGVGAPPTTQPIAMGTRTKTSLLQQALGSVGGAQGRDAKSTEDSEEREGTVRTIDQRGRPGDTTSDGMGGPANVRLFRYNPNGPSICGGLVSSKKGPKRFCISTVCGLAHTKKAFEKLGEGNYYIVEPGG
jgi:hypothetical protein